MFRFTVTLGVLLLTGTALAAPPNLPSGYYQGADGAGLMLSSNANGWMMSDPTAPAVTVHGDYKGGCQVVMAGQKVPCTTQIGNGTVALWVPMIGWSTSLQYRPQGLSGAVAAAPQVHQPTYQPPQQVYQPSQQPVQAQQWQIQAQQEQYRAQQQQQADQQALAEYLMLLQAMGYTQEYQGGYNEGLYGNGGDGGYNYNSNQWGGGGWGYGGSDGNTSYYNTGSGGVMCEGGSCEVW